MITVKISHGSIQRKLALPCSDAKLQEQLTKFFLDIPHRFMVTDISPPGLAVLVGQEIDLDELNFLARNMERYGDQERTRFLAAVQLEKPTNLKSFINLSFNTDRYTLISNFTDLAPIGKVHLLNPQGGENSPIDFLPDQGDDHVLLFKNEDVQYREVYNGTAFPYDPDRESLATVMLEFCGKSEWLYLPEDEISIEKAVARLGAPSVDACRAEIEDLPNDEWFFRLNSIVKNEGVYVANTLASALDSTDIDWGKLSAVMAYANVSDSENITALARHLDDFVFIKDAETDEDVGHHFVNFDSEYRAAPELADYIDFDSLGNQISEDREGQFVDGGFVCMDSGCSLEMILEDDMDFTMRGI